MTKNMRIEIAERYKPFSHLPGSSALLPNTTLCFQVYPASIHVYDLSGPTKKLVREIPLACTGIVEGFTLQQDLEKGCLKVWGNSKQGYFRYRIEASSSADQFIIIPEKEASGSLLIHESSLTTTPIAKPSQTFENLSFGVSKSQDWPMINRRQKLMEILPLWFRLSQWVPSLGNYNEIAQRGTLELLHQAHKALDNDSPEELAAALRSIYLAGFDDFLVPRISDELHQGFNLTPRTPHDQSTPLLLLTEGKKLIKQMIIKEENSQIQILPCLPAEFHCGRLLNTSLSAGVMDLEWSKKTIRRMLFRPTISEKLTFQFPSKVKTFRLRRKRDDSIQFKTCGEPIEFCSTDHYFFDNFRH